MSEENRTEPNKCARIPCFSDGSDLHDDEKYFEICDNNNSVYMSNKAGRSLVSPSSLIKSENNELWKTFMPDNDTNYSRITASECDDEYIQAGAGGNNCTTVNNICEELGVKIPLRKDLTFILIPTAFYLIMGIITIVGNAVVIYENVRVLLRRSKLSQDKKVYKVLILNLGVSDFLMGLYVTLLSIATLPLFTIHFDMFEGTSLCNVLGIFSYFSGQVSVTLLLIISGFRTFGMVYPYKVTHWKFALALATLCWIIWLTLSILPTLEYADIANIFRLGVTFKQNESETQVYFWQARDLLRRSSMQTHDKEFCIFTNNLLKNTNNEHVISILQSLKILNFNTTNARSFGYYDPKSFCTLNVFTNSAEPSFPYTLFIVLYNITVFTVILLAYCTILIKFSRANHRLPSNIKFRPRGNKFCFCMRCPENQTEKEEGGLSLRIFVIILSDFLCWIPVCVIFLIDSSSPPQYDCNSKKSIQALPYWVGALAIWSLPINSLLNPYIYSSNLWKKKFKTLKSKHLNRTITLPISNS